MKTFTCLLTLLCALQWAHAQERRVQGTVRASDNAALPGANVRLKGSTTGTVTDASGRFSLPVPDKRAVLVFSFTGFQTQEVPVSDTAVNITLSGAATLNEVLVVAYGTANKISYTGSASTVNAKDLERQQVSSISRALQGTVPGVQSVSSAGQPGSNATIRIRGIGSINASSDPLYVVDGVPFSGNINSINPADIQSISVLKDAAAGALYGSRAANGVIIIATKQGRINSKPVVTLSASTGYSSRAVDDYEKLDAKDYFEMQWEALRNKQLDLGRTAAQAAQYASDNVVSSLKINPFGSAFPTPIGTDGKLVAGAKPLWTDDWGKSTQRTGIRQQIDLNVSGGSENSKYFVSAGYLNDDGFIIGSGYTRYNGRVNYTTKVNKWFETGVNVAISSAKQDAPPQSDSDQGNLANFGRLVANIYPIYERNADGTLKLDQNGNKIYDFGNYRPSAAATGNNLLGSTYLNKYLSRLDNLTFRGYIQINILENLKLKSSINADYNNTLTHNYSNPVFGGSVSTRGSVSKGDTRFLAYTVNNILDYTFSLQNQHHFNILAGQEVYILNTSSLSGSKSNFGFLGKDEPNAASLLTGFSGSSDNYKLASYLAKVDYNFADKYFLSGSFRRDGSSRFHPDSRWGNFWSVGASWNVTREDFFHAPSWLDVLKLRASYGAQGNDNLGGYYQYQDLYSIYNSLGEAGVITSRLPTPGLKWETNLNFNAGVDVAFLKNRIILSAEYFERSSKDLLYQRPLAPSLGFPAIDDNIGSLTNKGWELQLQTTPVITKDFKWDVGVNLSHFKNEITSLPAKEIVPANTSVIGPTKKLTVGGSVYDFFIREWAGVDQTTGLPSWYKNTYETLPNGERKITGRTTTSVYAQADQYIVGSSLPDLTGGINTVLNYRGIELSALLAFNIGGKVLDYDLVMLSHSGNNTGRTWSKEILNRWTPDRKNADVPRLTTDATNWNSASTRFLYDATYARLRNIGLSYTLPASWTSGLRLQQIRVYTRGENLLTFYKHDGLDPEQALDGVTFYRYPAQKTFSFGFDVSF